MMSSRKNVRSGKLWKIGIGVIASIAMLLPMGAASNAAEVSGDASSATGDVAINTKNFPDSNLRKYLSNNFDRNHDGTFSAAERNSVTEILDEGSTSREPEYPLSGPIESVEGIRFFPNLMNLGLSVQGQLTSLDVSHNQKLEYLNVSNYPVSRRGNRLTSLDVSRNPRLRNLQVDGNELSRLDVSRNIALEMLYVSANRLTSLDVSKNLGLRDLIVHDNELSRLDVSRNTELWRIEASDNRLTELDVSHNSKLDYLGIGSNRLTNIDLSGNTYLRNLSADKNQLYALDVRNTQLNSSSVESNRLLAYRESANAQNNVFAQIDSQNAYPVDDHSLNLKQLIPWFDLSKVSNVRGGTISRAGVIAPAAGANPGAVVSYDYAAGASGTLHASVSFTMKGAAVPVVYRTVAFDSAGGSKVASQKVANGGKVKQPANPTRAGYSFAGWYYGSAKWDFNRGVTANITLTAKWTKNATPSKPTDQVKRVPVYRVYNRNSGLHHYTVSKAESDMLVRLGWRDENRGGSAFVTVSKDTPGARPVYREYNRRSGNHNWTLNKAEHDMLVRLGWKDEGIAWYTSPTGRDVYRLYNPKPYHKPKNGRGNGGGEHVYTTSYGEYRAVVRAGWRGEGVAWQSL